VRAKGLAQGVTLRYRGSVCGLPEYELTLAPGAELGPLRRRYSGEE